MSQYSHLTADLSNENSAAAKIARLVGRDRVVLDVGCAHGYMAEALRGQGCRVFGIELDPEDGARARAHCEQVLIRDVEEPGWEDELTERSFDTVIFSDVLEHLRYPARVLQRTVELLKPERGFIVASVPNVAHVSIRLELLLGSFRRESLGILDETHLHFFTRESLHELLASCGVAVESWECTTNEISERVVADYLRRTGLPYTAAVREMFEQFDSMAYQFIIKARPSAVPIQPLPEPLPKPLESMAATLQEFERLRAEEPRLHTELSRLHTELSRLDRELSRSNTELSRSNTELGQLNRELSRSQTECTRLSADLARLRTSPADLAQPREGGLRVLQVVHQFLPRHTAGTEIYCSDLSFALTRRGNAVHVLSGAHHPDDVGTTVQWEGDHAIVVERTPATRTFRRWGSVARYFDRFDNPEARLAIRAALDRIRPDVVHAQHLLYLSAELIPECRIRGIPVVVMLNDYWFFCHQVRLKRRDGTLCEGPVRGWKCSQCFDAFWPIRSRLNPASVAANMYRYTYLTRQLLKADRILAPSRYLRDVFGRNGVPAERIIHFDYGTVVPPPEMAERLAAPRRHERVRFGFLGTFLRDKGVHVLVDAFTLLPSGCAELHLFGAPVDPPYFEELEPWARHPNIHWRGALEHAERWQALAEIDVLVVPSIWQENSPLTIHEALMARVPVIGSAAGGIPELVHDGVTGLIFPIGDVNALASCLRQVVTDRECVTRWRRAIIPPQTMDDHAQDTEGMYRELLAAR